jgi:hypothetical protein
MQYATGSTLRYAAVLTGRTNDGAPWEGQLRADEHFDRSEIGRLHTVWQAPEVLVYTAEANALQ